MECCWLDQLAHVPSVEVVSQSRAHPCVGSCCGVGEGVYEYESKNQAKKALRLTALSPFPMGGTKVTYAIGYTNVSSLQVDIRNMRLRAKRLRSEGNEISSARLGIECAELLIEYADQPDSDLSEAKQEEHRENNLSKAIKYAKDGYEVLIRVNNPYRDTIKALELMTDAYRRYIIDSIGMSRAIH